MGGQPNLAAEVQDSEKPEARWHGCREHKEACLQVLPAEVGARAHRTVLALGEGQALCAVLVVPGLNADKGPPFQGVFEVEGAAEDRVDGDEERDREGEEPLEDPGSAGG